MFPYLSSEFRCWVERLRVDFITHLSAVTAALHALFAEKLYEGENEKKKKVLSDETVKSFCSSYRQKIKKKFLTL